MKLFQRKIVKKRQMWAVTCGQYMGDFFIFTSNNPESKKYEVIILPHLIRENIPEEYINNGIKKGILDFVEKLERRTYKETLLEVSYRENRQSEMQKKVYDEYYNRRKQFITQDILDIKEQKNKE